MRFALLLLLVACETKSDKYCLMNPNDSVNCGGSMMMPDAPPVGPVCTGDDDCSGATPHCLDMTACVGCRDANDCTAQACDTSSHTCRACTANAECPSQLCLPGGACAAPTDVAYVGGNTVANAACTLDAPCASLSTAIALPTYPKYIRVLSDITETDVVDFTDTHTLEIFGGGSKVKLDLAGAGLNVSGSMTLTLHAVDLSHANGSSTTMDHGVNIASPTATLTVEGGAIHDCGGDAIRGNSGTVSVERTAFSQLNEGIAVFGGLKLSVSHATFTNISQSAIYSRSTAKVAIDSSVIAKCANVIATDLSTYSAIDIVGSIDLINSIVVQNGGTPTGQPAIKLAENAPSTIDFVTLADNVSKALTCNSSGDVTFTNSIVTGNSLPGPCVPSYAVVDSNPNPANHQVTGNPAFDNTSDAASAKFYRIKTSSAAIGIGLMDGVTVDIDGDARTSTPDVGADELVP